MESAYAERVKLRARRQAQYRALRDRPCVSKDGQKFSLMINAGLPVDLPHLEETGAAGIGLFRTELQFMVADTLPRTGEQLTLYRAVLDAADKRPVTFRTLDIGGDKVLPYMRNVEEENPALGWRAIRLGLDRPGLLRSQVRALLRAGGGRELKLMFPMIAMVEEFDEAKALVERELTHLRRHGHALPERVEIGTMVEVPSLLFQLDELLSRVDFLSVGSNDLMQFLYAADRGNARVATRFDPLSAPVLRALKDIADKAKKHNKPVTLCGELASQPIGALALAILGYRSLSLSPSAVGPVKAMLLDLDAARARKRFCRCWRCRSAACRSATSSRISPWRKGCSFDDAAAAEARCPARPPRPGGKRARHRPRTRRLRQAFARIRRAFAGGRCHQGLPRRRRRNRRSRCADRRQHERRRDAADGAKRKADAGGAARQAGAAAASGADPQGRDGRPQRHPRNPRRHRRRRGGAVRRRSVPHVRALRRDAGLEGRNPVAERRQQGGFKEIIAEVRGRGVFAKLKFESGVHRVQRVPDTEASGRIHTSAATVAVLPEVEDVDVDINEADLKIDTMRAQGAGGQHVNKTESAIRITHLPSGIVVLVQEERSQHKNRAKAMTMLRAKLYDQERSKRDAERAAERRGQVGSGDRSERIRTYNFPQGRVTDHRINLTLYTLPKVMEGEGLSEIIDALITEHQAELLAAEGAA